MHGCLYQEGLTSMMLGVSWDVDNNPLDTHPVEQNTINSFALIFISKTNISLGQKGLSITIIPLTNRMCLPCQIVDRSKYPIPQLSFPWNDDLSDWTHSMNLSAQPFVIVLLCILFFSFRVQQILTLDSNLFSPHSLLSHQEIQMPNNGVVPRCPCPINFQGLFDNIYSH